MRSSWDYDSSAAALDTPNFSNLQCEESINSFDASQYSDRFSFSSDENLFQLPDFEINFPARITPSLLSASSDFDAVRSDMNLEHIIEEQHDDTLDDTCVGVTYKKTEDNRYRNLSLPDLSPINPYSDSNASSPGADTATSGLTVVDHREEEANVDLVSSELKENKEMNSFFVPTTPEKISPWQPERLKTSSRRLRTARSRSCKASLMMSPSSYWFEKEEIIDNTKRPEGVQREDHVDQPDYNSNAEMLPRNEKENLEGSDQLTDHEVSFFGSYAFLSFLEKTYMKFFICLP